MYLEHFRLNELPFTLTPDTSFFMSRAGYQDALNVLLVALRSGEGFVKVTGEVGTGKTMLCRTLINTLADEFATAYIPNPYLKPTTLLLSVADELGIEYPEKIGQHAFMKLLNKGLLNFHAQGKRVLVCLDEAQAIPIETLETLRLLTNLETEKSKLIQVVLFGQPELDTVLKEPSIRQLRQRISFSYEILPLTTIGADQYIAHRLAVAGYDGPILFTRKAMDALYRGSSGIPRLVNIIAHKSLMAAFGGGSAAVEVAHVRSAIDDTTEARQFSRSRLLFGQQRLKWLFGGLGAFSLTVVALVSLYFANVFAMLP
ncbi:MAG: AAA family ATPase [Proteobacteria bacterium]|nr:AAA family ATPase [Pseudomonadota bacterium]MCZ6893461.1 AAA family ATPase [Gammaproteobacteria bacterium]